MATEKIIQTRILNKIDSLENWNKSSLIIKQGEICLATVAASAGTGLTEPVVMAKVGTSEEKTFAELPWSFYAKASDVLEAAKSEEGLKAFVNSVIADSGIASSDAMETLAGRVTGVETAIETLNGDDATSGSIAKAIKDAIDALNLADTYATKEDTANQGAVILAESQAYTIAEVAKDRERLAILEAIDHEAYVAADTALKTELQSKIAAEENRAKGVESGFDTRIKAIEDDYLKASDKEDLQTQINTIMNNPDTEGVINSINEFTQYIEDHGEIAEGFRMDIDKNKEDIAELQASSIVDVTELPNPNTTAKVVNNREDVFHTLGYSVHCVETLQSAGSNPAPFDKGMRVVYYDLSNNSAHVYFSEEFEGVAAGWHTAEEILGDGYGGIITSIAEDPCDGKLRILVKPASGEINEETTYRVLNGTFVHNMMLQNHCVCHTVEWADGPEGIGEPVLSFPDNALGVVVAGYYNITNNTVYGYFDDITIEELGYYIDSLDLNDLVKLALKAALKTTSKGWKTLEEVVDLVGSATSMSWGGIIADITEATNNDGLYLLLSSKYYYHRNNKWITTDNGIGMLGQFAGAEIFNDPHNIARGKASHAEGRETEAGSDAAHAEGYRTQALAKMSHAEGEETIAEGPDAHAEGYKTHGYGQASHAEGTLTWATGAHAHAEGYDTRAAGSASHAGGIGTQATGEAQTVIGRHNVSDTNKAFIIGNGSGASAKSNAMTVDWEGNAEFKGAIKSSGKTLATENYVDDKVAKVDLTRFATIDYVNSSYTTAGKKAGTTLGINSTAEGFDVTASGAYVHAEGYGTFATGDFAHVEGVSSVASGQIAHAEGISTTASGLYSHSQGESTVASGHASHAEGKGTIAAGTAQHVQGFYNIEDADSNYLHIVGNGSDDTNRSNAHTIDWDGNAWFKGDVKVGGTGQDDETAKTLVHTVSAAEGSGLKATKEGASVTIDWDSEVVLIFDCGNSGVTE